MFTLFTHKEYGMPSIVSENSKEYPVYVMSGNYLNQFSGTKRDCEEMQEEILGTLLIND